MTGADRVKVAAQGQPLTDYGVGSSKQVSDLIDGEVAIEWSGTTGKVKGGNIKDISAPWTDFDSANNTGHFFPIELDQKYQGEPITVIGKKQKTVADRFWVLRVENAEGNKFTFKKGTDLLFVLDFSEATLA